MKMFLTKKRIRSSFWRTMTLNLLILMGLGGIAQAQYSQDAGKYLGKKVADYSGTTEDFVVPSRNLDSIYIKVWGAAGGKGFDGGAGAGAYIGGDITTMALPGLNSNDPSGLLGVTLKLNVGQGGRQMSADSNSGTAFAGGGSGGVNAGGGGGYSGIFKSSISQSSAIVIAAGGGGSGEIEFIGSAPHGRGGNQVSYSGGASALLGNNGKNGSLIGGATAGGGGGYFGGQSGENSDGLQGGYGGTSFISPTGYILTNTAGAQGANSNPNAPNSGDADYASGIARATSTNGGNGRIVIVYKVTSELTTDQTTLNLASTTYGAASASSSFTVNWYYLNSTSVTVAAPAGFEVSTDNSTFSSSVNIATTNLNGVATTIYVRKAASNLLNVGSNTGNVTIQGNNQTLDGSLNKTVEVHAEVTPAPLTISNGTLAFTKVYDQNTTANPTGNPVLNGVVGSDGITINTGSITFSYPTKNVGTHTVTSSLVTTANLNDPNNKLGNYTFTDVSLSISGTITQKSISAPIGVPLSTWIIKKEYDASTTFNISNLMGTTPDFVINTPYSGDDVQLSLNNAAITFNSATAGTDKTGNITNLELEGADAGNYVLSSNTMSFSKGEITKKPLTLAKGDFHVSKTYDGNTTFTGTPTGSLDLQGIIAGDNVSLDMTFATITFPNSDANTYNNVTIGEFESADLNGTHAGNYSLAPITLNIDGEINARTLQVPASTSAASISKEYDGGTGYTGSLAGLSEAMLPVNQGGPLAGDVVQFDFSAATVTYDDKNVGNANKSGTITGIDLSGADAHNYSMANNSMTFNNATIEVKDLSIATGGLYAEKIYDGTNIATGHLSGTPTYIGIALGDDISIDGDFTFESLNVGSNYRVYLNNVMLTGQDAGNYELNTTAFNFKKPENKITTKELTLDLSDLQVSKTYDGNTTIDKSYVTGTPALTGVLAQDATIVSIYDDGTVFYTYDNKNVSNGKTVTAENFQISGAGISNYHLASGTGTFANGEITKRDLGVNVSSLVANTKVYDGNTTATLASGTPTLDAGYVAGDDVVLDDASAFYNFNNKNVAVNKTIIGQGYTISGNDTGNYNFLASNTFGGGEITQKPLSLDLSGLSTTKTYDATTDVDNNDVNGTALLVGVVSGDENDVQLVTTNVQFTYIDAEVGSNKTVNAIGYEIDGDEASNYLLNGSASFNQGEITSKLLTVDFSSVSMTKEYDGSLAPGTLTGTPILVGVETGDVVDIDFSNVAYVYTDKNVGTGKTIAGSGFALTGANANNYSISATQSFSNGAITQRDLHVDLTNLSASKEYDGNNSVSFVIGTPTLDATDLVSSDDVTLDFTGATYTYDNKNVGTGKTVNAAGFAITGTDAPNYNVITTGSFLDGEITQKALSVDISGMTFSKVYDGNTDANSSIMNGSPVFVGLVSGDLVNMDLTSVDYQYDTKKAGTGKTVSATGFAITGTDAGNYNFTSTASNTTAEILGQDLYIDMSGSYTTKVYDGNTDVTDISNITPALGTGYVAGNDVILKSDDVTYSYDNKHAGTGKTVTGTGFTIEGTDADNYILHDGPTFANGEITQKALTITALDVIKCYNSAYDGLASTSGFTVSGLVTGDSVATVDLTSTGSGALASPADYNLVPSNAVGYNTDMNDYSITYVNGNLRALAKLYANINGVANLEVCAGNGVSLNYTLSGPGVLDAKLEVYAIYGGGETFVDTFWIKNKTEGASQSILLPASLTPNSGNDTLIYRFRFTEVVSDATNYTGCPSVTDGQVDVQIYPSPDLAVVAPLEVCSGESFTIEVNNPNNLNGSTYKITPTYGSLTGGIIPAAGSANTLFSAADYSETLVNNGSAPATVTYLITSKGASPKSCIGGDTTITITINNLPQTQLTFDGAVVVNNDSKTVCEGDQVSIDIVGGDASDTYELTIDRNDGNGPQSIENGIIGNFTGPYIFHANPADDAGVYTLNLATDKGCVTSYSYTLNVNPLPVVDLVVNGNVVADGDTIPVCEGTPMTIAMNETIGGTFELDFNGTTLQGGNTSDPAYPFTAALTDDGVYTFTFETANGCSNSQSFTLVVNPLPTHTLTFNGNDVTNNSSQEICEGESVTIILGDIPSTTSWTLTTPFGTDNGNGPHEHQFTASLADNGTHTLVLETEFGCQTTTTYDLIVNPLPTFDFAFNGSTISNGGSEVVCEGSSVSVSLTGLNATDEWTLQIPNYPAQSGTGDMTNYPFTAAMSDAGQYSLTVTTASGCTTTTTYDLVVNPLPAFNFAINGTTMSNGAADTVCEGTPVSVSLTGLNSGDTWSLQIPNYPAQNGTGDMTNYDFTAAMSDAGQYSLTVTTAAGCETTTTYDLVVNPLPTFDFAFNGSTISNGGSETVCEGSSVSVSLTGLNATDEWTLQIPNYSAQSGTGDMTNYPFTAAMSDAGQYSLTVTTASGCTTTTTYDLVVNPLPTFDFAFNGSTVSNGGSEVVCEGSSVEVSLIGLNATDEWTLQIPNYPAQSGIGDMTNYPFTAAMSDAGQYSLTITTASGCTTTTTYDLIVNPLPTFDFAFNGTIMNNGDAETVCEGSSVSVSLTGLNATDEWTLQIPNYPAQSGTGDMTNYPFTAAISDAGQYSLTVTTASGCTTTTTYDLVVNPLPIYEANVNGSDVYNGSTIEVCEGSSVEMFVGNIPNSTNWTLTTPTGTLQGNGSVENDFTAALANGGQYGIELISEFGCVTTMSFELVVNPLPTYSLSVNGTSLANDDQYVICADEDVVIDLVSNATSYTLSTGGTVIHTGTPGDGYTISSAQVSASGIYTLTMESDEYCTVAMSFDLKVNGLPLFEVTESTDVNCYGGNDGKFKFKVTNSASDIASFDMYIWNDANPTDTLEFYSYSNVASGANVTGTKFNLVAGEYTVSLVNSLGCATLEYVTVAQPPALTLNMSHQDVTCGSSNNGKLFITPGGGTVAGNYTIDLYKNGTQINAFTAPGGTVYTVNNLSAGTYTVELTDDKGCMISQTEQIIAPTANVVVTATGPSSVMVGGTATVNFSSTGAVLPVTYTYTVNGGSTQTITSSASSSVVTVNVPTSAAGHFDYVVTDVTDANGSVCNKDLSAGQQTVEVTAPSNIDLESSVYMANNSVSNAQPSQNANIYLLNSGNAATNGSKMTLIVNKPSNGLTLDFSGNPGWTVLSAGNNYILESNNIITNGNWELINVNIIKSGNVATGSYKMTINIAPNSGGDINMSNNTSSYFINVTE